MRAGLSTVRLLQHSISRRYGCRARLVGATRVVEVLSGHPVWESVVHEFDLRGRAIARRCYAWEEPWDVVTMLHGGSVDSAIEAVRISGRSNVLAAPA